MDNTPHDLRSRMREVDRDLGRLAEFARSKKRSGYVKKIKAIRQYIDDLARAYEGALLTNDGLHMVNDMLADEHRRQTRIENAVRKLYEAQRGLDQAEELSRALKDVISSNRREARPPS